VLSFSRNIAGVIRSAALLLFAAALTQASAVTVDPVVTDNGGLFHYAYSISNTGADDAFLIDIPVPADPAAILDLTVPAGFKSQFDSGLGLVSFLEDSASFTATPTSGFSFDSNIGPSTVNFVASLFDSNFNISTISGTTLAPGAASTPEPNSLYLLAFAAPVFLLLQRRFKGGSNLPVYTKDTEAPHVSNC
jgi:hypothetical protein